MNDAGSRAQAKADLDTSALVPNVPPAPASAHSPAQTYYWVQGIVQIHEIYHANDFLWDPVLWEDFMWNHFQSDVEQTSVFFDCNDPQTTTQASYLSREKALWDNRMLDAQVKAVKRYHDKDGVFDPITGDRLVSGAEVRAHGDSNPRYEPIRQQIP